MRYQLWILFVLFSYCSLKEATAQSITADPLTGKPSVNLPIWTVNSGDLSASISLSYYGGPKVNDLESSAGMGWSLVAGGGVYREIKSLPDDFIGAVPSSLYKGWLHGSIARNVNSFVPAATNYSICSAGEVADWNAMSNFTYSDTQPDVFSFQAPGLSGQFIFDQNKVVRTIPYQDINVQVSRRNIDSLISQIVITNNKGFKYTFIGGDMTTRTTTGNTPNLFTRLYSLYQQPIIYYSSWYLTNITSPNGASITFTYGDAFTAVNGDPKQAVNATTSKVDTLYTDNFSTVSQLLQTISGGNEKATFIWTGNLLSSVSITDNTYQSMAKNFNLQYHYVKASKKVQQLRSVKRAFLSGLTETLNCSALPGYSFNYYGVNFLVDSTSLPFNSGVRQDLFGYYDSTAISAIPDIYVKSGDAGLDGERYRIAPASGYSLMGTANGGRVVNASKVYFGSLKSVILPSGGTITYAYEAADYYDPTTNSSILGGGARVKSIRTSANDPSSDMTTTYKYRTSANLSSGQWTYRPMFVAFNSLNVATRIPYNLAPNESILYSRVEASTTGKGKTVYEFQNTGMYPVISANTDFNATLTRLARPTQSPCESLGSVRSGYYTYPYTPNTNYDFERGLPVRISDYSRAGKVVQRKLYTYQRTTLPIAQVSGISYDILGDIYEYGKYTLLSNVNKMTATETSRVYDQTDTTQFVETASTYTYNSNQMLAQTGMTNSDNSSLVKTYKYAKDYATTGTDQPSQMINALVSNNQHGTLIESVSYSGSAVTGATLTLFNNNFGTAAIRPSQLLVLGDPTGFTPSTVSGASFVKSPNYYTSAFFDAYDPYGHPLVIRDQSRAVRSSIMGYYGSAAALNISNARYDQVAFSDFEPVSDAALQSSASIINTDCWSGKNCTALTSGGYVYQNIVVRGLGKNYRFSCWAKASAATTLTLGINGGTVATVAYPNSGSSPGSWQYIEATVDMSTVGVGTNFSFKATATGSISLDNVVFYPASASVTTHVYDPLNGKTADLDSRGVSGFQEYDVLGRPRYIRNMDKDIVQIKDYHYLSSNGILPVSSFVGTSTPDMGVATTYTANPTCEGGVTYAWYVDDIVQTSTSTTMAYTFNNNKTYRVTLVASGSFGSSSTDLVVNPVPVLNASISLSAGPVPIGAQYCDDLPHWTLTINLGGCYDLSKTTYAWYYKVGSNPTANPLTVDPSTITSVDFSAVNNIDPTTVYCKVTTTCTNSTTGNTQSLVTIASLGGFVCRIRPNGQ